MLYKILADSTVVVHFLWIVFLLLGAFWGIKNKAVKIFHISGFAFAFVVQILGWYCPLTYLEVWLRSRHNSALAYTGSFIIHYVEELVYIDVSRTLIFFFTLLIFGFNVWFYLKKGKPSNEYGGFMLTADRIIALLNLTPHPKEGGYFRETYRSSQTISEKTLPHRYAFATAIYYLLTPATFSAMHRLQSDEIFHFYLGDPVEMLQLLPDGSGKTVMLGSDLLRGMQPQVIVPRGAWQGAKLLKNGEFALLGTTVSPGFEFVDYESGQRDDLIEAYPQFREWIITLTRANIK